MSSTQLALRQLRVIAVERINSEIEQGGEFRLAGLPENQGYCLVSALAGTASWVGPSGLNGSLGTDCALLVCASSVDEESVSVISISERTSLLIVAFECSGDLFSMVERGLPKVIPISDPVSIQLIAVLGSGAIESPGTGPTTALKIIEGILASAVSHVMVDESLRSDLTLVGRSSPISHALVAIQAKPEAPWSVAEIARVARMSPTRLAATFRDVVGAAPMEYVTQWRMALARQLLEDDPLLLVSEVARRVGYATPFSFSTAFKRYFGVSPSVVRTYLEAH